MTTNPHDHTATTASTPAVTMSNITGNARSSRTLRALVVDADATATGEIEREFPRSGVSVTIARSALDARISLRQSAIDVVILELSLPDERGESLLRDIESCDRQPAVIIVSDLLPDLQSAALEYRPVTIPKPIPAQTLLRMVRAIAPGYAQPTVRRFVRRFNLSVREAEATVFIARGLKAKEIADRMRCSEKTVYAHLMRVCAKTGCRDYHEVVAMLLAFTCHALGHTPPDHPAFHVLESETAEHQGRLSGGCRVDAPTAPPPPAIDREVRGRVRARH